MNAVMDSVGQTVESWRQQGIVAEVVHQENAEATEHEANLELSGLEKDDMKMGRLIVSHPPECGCDLTGAAADEVAPDPPNIL